MTACFAWPRMMDPDQAMAYVGGPKIFDDLKKKELVEPRTQTKGLTRYDRLSLDAALDRWKGFDAE